MASTHDETTKTMTEARTDPPKAAAGRRTAQTSRGQAAITPLAKMVGVDGARGRAGGRRILPEAGGGNGAEHGFHR